MSHMINKLLQFTDKYFTNIGTKLKNWAKWSFIVEAVACLIAAPICFISFFIMSVNSYYYAGEYMLYAFLSLLALPIALSVALVSNWPLYAFGELVERVCSMDDNVKLMTIPVKENSRETIEAAEEAARQAAEEAAAEEARRNEEAKAKRKAQMEAMTKNANTMAKQAKQTVGGIAKHTKQAVSEELNRRKEEEKARKEALKNYNPAEEAARHQAENVSRQEAEENARRVVEERMRRIAEEKSTNTDETNSDEA